MVIVNLAMASICFMGSCYPALVGHRTPTGTYTLSRQQVMAPGYGGDILVFKEGESVMWAIHRVYTLNAGERRVERLKSREVEQRRFITNGCVNVMVDVYQKLVDCCSRDVLVIV